MANNIFYFKKFKIKQNNCSMKVGTDAVLLGAWVKPKKSTKILDIGTGTGIIALMLAQKSIAKITAIEINKESAEQARDNVAESDYYNKIDIKHISIQQYSLQCEDKFDLIITNPPYFINAYKSKDKNRVIARHTDTLPFIDLLNCVKKLLYPKGKFCLILPLNEAYIFKEMAEVHGFYLTKLLRIKTKIESNEEKRHLMQFEFQYKQIKDSILIIEEKLSRNYTIDYKNFTKDYYIKF
jgi:tRNA1Val (adenine37-N6)-methyltransferase